MGRKIFLIPYSSHPRRTCSLAAVSPGTDQARIERGDSQVDCFARYRFQACCATLSFDFLGNRSHSAAGSTEKSLFDATHSNGFSGRRETSARPGAFRDASKSGWRFARRRGNWPEAGKYYVATGLGLYMQTGLAPTHRRLRTCIV
jgi:hypothetical protein